MELEVFFSIIVGKLFARLDRAEGEYVDPAITDPHLAIRIAGVIDEACDIRWNVSIDHADITRPEEVLPAILLDLFFGGRAPEIFNDACTLGYALLSKKTSATVRPKHYESEGCRHR